MMRITVSLCFLSCALLLAVMDSMADELPSGEFAITVSHPDGTPAVGVEVVCVEKAFGVFRTTPATEKERATTDQDGACLFTGLRQEDHLICCRLTDAAAWTTKVAREDQQIPVQLVLNEHKTFGGIVLDEQGNPVADVGIYALGCLPVSASQEDGHWQIEHLDGNRISNLLFIKDGYGIKHVSLLSVSGPVTVEMAKGITLEVHVTDDAGAPASWANVDCMGEPTFRDTCDGNGIWRRPLLSPGYRARTQFFLRNGEHASYAELDMDVNQAPVQVEHLQLKPFLNVAMTGKVRMKGSREPVPAAVWYGTGVPYDKYFGDNQVHTSSDGSFEIRNLPASRYYLLVKPDDKTLPVSTDQALAVDLRDGKPVKNIVLTVQTDVPQPPPVTPKVTVPRADPCEDELERWVEAFRKKRNYEEVALPPVPSTQTKKKMARLISERLGSCGDRDADALARTAQELNLKPAAAAVREAYLRRIPQERVTLQHSATLANALAALAGDDAVEVFVDAVKNPAVAPETKMEALVAMGSIRTNKAVRAYVELREAAYQKAGAPQKQETYTDAEKILETLQMVLHVIPYPEQPGSPEWVPRSLKIEIDDTQKRAQAAGKVLERFGDEWMVVDTIVYPGVPLFID